MRTQKIQNSTKAARKRKAHHRRGMSNITDYF